MDGYERASRQRYSAIVVDSKTSIAQALAILSDLCSPRLYSGLFMTSFRTIFCDEGSGTVSTSSPRSTYCRLATPRFRLSLFAVLAVFSDPATTVGLRELDLSYASLSGGIPASIGCCVKLALLNLSHNKLTGTRKRAEQGQSGGFDRCSEQLRFSLLFAKRTWFSVQQFRKGMICQHATRTHRSTMYIRTSSCALMQTTTIRMHPNRDRQLTRTQGAFSQSQLPYGANTCIVPRLGEAQITQSVLQQPKR